MKLKYFFKRIDSTAEHIYVESYGQNVFEFHKVDFDNDWKNILDRKYELDPCLIADLDKLKMFGNESHDIHYSVEDKYNWYRFARNKIRNDFFKNTERLAEIDTDKPVEIYNVSKITDIAELKSLVTSIPSTFKELDLSNLNMADEFTDDGDEQGYLTRIDGKTTTKIGYNWLGDNCKKIVKSPKLPTNLKALYYYFSKFESLKSIDNLNFSNIIEYERPFSDCKYLQDLSKINLENAVGIKEFALNFSDLHVLPDLSNLKSILNIYYMFSTCEGDIQDVGDINVLSEDSVVNVLFLNTSIKNVGDVYIAGETTGPLFANCNSLEAIGNVHIRKLNTVRVSNDMGFLYSHFSDYYPKSTDSTLKTIGNITIDEVAKQSITSSPTVESVGAIRIGKVNQDCAQLFFDYPKATIESVYVDDMSLSGGSVGFKALNIGPISVKTPRQSGNSIALYNVEVLKACPLYYAYGSPSFKNSTGCEYWVDFYNYSSTNSYVHTITLTNIDLTKHIETPDVTFKQIIPLDNLIALNPDYPYSFDLKDWEVVAKASEYSIKSNSTCSNLTQADVKTLKLVVTDDNKLGLELEVENVKDDATIVINEIEFTDLNVVYNADIEGVDFYGKIRPKFSGTITFELSEDIATDVQVEYDEGEEPETPPEETTE